MTLASVSSGQKATRTVNKRCTRKTSESKIDTDSLGSGSESGDSMSVDYDVLDDDDMEMILGVGKSI